MKRIAVFILAMLMILSAAGCSALKADNNGVSGETKKKKPKIKDVSVSEEYKSADGTVSFTFDAVVPTVAEGCAEEIAKDIDFVMNTYVEEARTFVKNNAENAASFMKDNNSKTPWSRSIDYETTYCDANTVCFLLKSSFSLDGSKVNPTYKTYCFNLNNSNRYSALDFARESKEYLLEDILPIIEEQLNKNLYNGSRTLNSVQIESIQNNFDFWNYFVDKDNIYFYIPGEFIDDTVSGYQMIKMPFKDVRDYFVSPDKVLDNQ